MAYNPYLIRATFITNIRFIAIFVNFPDIQLNLLNHF